jgi:antirestriction protein ArdC
MFAALPGVIRRRNHGGVRRGNRRSFSIADLGITPETRDDHAAYIASWLKVLKDDKRAIFTAASHAQKAADYLHGLQPQEAQS